MSWLMAYSVRPTAMFLLLLDFLFGVLLIARVGAAAIVSQLGPPPLVGIGMLALGLVQLIALAWRWPVLLLVTTAVSAWLWAMLAITSLIRLSSTGGVASFAVFAIMSAWVFGRVLVDVKDGKPVR